MGGMDVHGERLEENMGLKITKNTGFGCVLHHQNGGWRIAEVFLKMISGGWIAGRVSKLNGSGRERSKLRRTTLMKNFQTKIEKRGRRNVCKFWVDRGHQIS
jgi:hypothetical protein